MMMIARGLSLVISGVEAHLLQRHTGLPPDHHGIGRRQRSFPACRSPMPCSSCSAQRWSQPSSSPRRCLGRYTIAIGSNEEATRLSGVNVANWKTAVYALGGLFSGLAGVMIASRLNSAQPGPGRRLRARRHRRRSDRRHVAQRRRRHHPRHDHRRLHHQHADQWPAHPRRAPGVADGGHRRDRHPGRLPGYPAPTQREWKCRVAGDKCRWQVYLHLHLHLHLPPPCPPSSSPTTWGPPATRPRCSTSTVQRRRVDFCRLRHALCPAQLGRAGPGGLADGAVRVHAAVDESRAGSRPQHRGRGRGQLQRPHERRAAGRCHRRAAAAGHHLGRPAGHGPG